MLVNRRSGSVFGRNLTLLLAVLLLSGLFTSILDSPTASASALALQTPNSVSGPLEPKNSPLTGPIKVRNSDFIDATGSRFFLSGVNYEGHTDRAWSMWNDDKFDQNLINQNLALAAAGGHNAIRVFIQAAIRDDILSGKWFKLDRLVEIAAQNNLLVLITMADYDELDLTRLTQIDSLISKHFAGKPSVLGYDLKNEPQYYHLAGGKYPEGQIPLVQTDALIQAYGERITQADSEAYRKTATGQLVVPQWLSPRLAYYYTNGYKLYQSFLDEGSKWVVSHTNSNFIDWLKSPDSVYWKPFMDTMSATLDTWMSVRLAAIRANDPEKLTTIGFNHIYFAYLRANQALSFISLHRFEAEGASSIATTLGMLEQLKQQHAAKPVVLEEFGYTNSHGANKNVPLTLTANYEAAVWLFLYSRGFAGGFKWMLTNYPVGANAEENNYGLLDDQTQPKPSYNVTRAIHNYIAANRKPSGEFTLLESRDGSDVTYMWVAGDTIFSNLKDYTDNRIDLHQEQSVGWQIWWPGNSQKVLFSSASTGRVIFDLGKFFPAWNPGNSPATLNVEGGQIPPLDRKDALVSFAVTPGFSYTVNTQSTPGAFLRTIALARPDSLYFKETGHNLSGVFKTYWEKNGGLWLYGFPISEEFQEGGYIVQYFERNRFEYHPEATDPRYSILLGLLGLNVTIGRKEASDPPFLPAPISAAQGDRNYYRETSHTLGGVFRTYWQKYGGLAQFGFPISEEFTELNPSDGKTYTVQYFERARFENHPEAKGTPNEVLLGLLGVQVVKTKGWMN